MFEFYEVLEKNYDKCSCHDRRSKKSYGYFFSEDNAREKLEELAFEEVENENGFQPETNELKSLIRDEEVGQRIKFRRVEDWCERIRFYQINPIKTEDGVAGDGPKRRITTLREAKLSSRHVGPL